MIIPSKLLAATALSLAILAGAVDQSDAQPAGGAPGICQRDKAEALKGKRRVSDATARRLTGASIVRQIRPGQGVTMDYRQERVTIETDPRSRRIVRAYCG